MEYVLTMANLKLKPSLFAPPPIIHAAMFQDPPALHVKDISIRHF